MQRITMVMALMAAAALALVGAGCKEGAPLGDVEKFAAQYGGFEGQTLIDTLETLSAGDSEYRHLASYMLGNKYYKDANEIAATKGWGDGTVNALLDTSEIYFNRAIAQDSTMIEALVNLGALWDDRSQQLGSREDRDRRLTEAEKYYRMALDLDPHSEKARCNLGGLFQRQGQPQKALAEFLAVLEHDPESALAHYNVAIMFAEAKIYREALREWELAVKHEPDSDIGQRSRENIKIVKDLMNAPDPELGH
jgi:tetratricopeptide (TPR) repeat protein